MKELNKELAVRSLIRGEFCPICKEKRGGKQLLCDACADVLAAEMRRGCAVCGESMQDCTCSTVALRRVGASHLFKLFSYDPKDADTVANKMIFALKTRRDRLLFRLTARLMSYKLKEALNAIREVSDEEIQPIITYIPRSRKRIRKVGIDQSKVLAKQLSKEMSIPFATLLKRCRRAKTQKSLSVFDRRKNASSLFKLKNVKKLKNATVILVDDLVASGNTMAQAGEILMHGEANQVIMVCVASLWQKSEAERFEEYAKNIPLPPESPGEDIFERTE
jgi:ComF family protein